jgi:hypothetical protein
MNDRLAHELNEVYSNLKVHRGDVHEYLGMELIFNRDSATCDFSMCKNVDKLLAAHPPPKSGPHGVPSSPASDDLFKVTDDVMRLSEDNGKIFHTAVAKCLYLSRRRVDVAPAVAFLCTRVQNPTVEDQGKLNRLLGYLSSTKKWVMRIDGSSSDQVIAYVDASYGVHMNRKSHTGVIISIGRGAVFTSSTKQKLVTKSSTEAELVGLSDALSQILWSRYFMEAQGYPQKPAHILQDNESTIRLATHGRSDQSRMRHVDIRYFFIKDRSH